MYFSILEKLSKNCFYLQFLILAKFLLLQQFLWSFYFLFHQVCRNIYKLQICLAFDILKVQHKHQQFLLWILFSHHCLYDSNFDEHIFNFAELQGKSLYLLICKYNNFFLLSFSQTSLEPVQKSIFPHFE